MTQFYKQYKSIEPYLQNENPPEKGKNIILNIIVICFLTRI